MIDDVERHKPQPGVDGLIDPALDPFGNELDPQFTGVPGTVPQNPYAAPGQQPAQPTQSFSPSFPSTTQGTGTAFPATREELQ